MLIIREAQMEAFRAALEKRRARPEFAAELIDTGYIDLTNPDHLAIIGGDEAEEPEARLARFAAAALEQAAQDGIEHPMVLLDWVMLPFRFGAAWRSDPVARKVLADPSLDQWQKAQRIYDRFSAGGPR